MQTVTISQKEYNELIDKKLRYEYLHQIIEGDLFSPPPTKDVEEVADSFEATGLYNKKFIDSLKKGLKRSTHFR